MTALHRATFYITLLVGLVLWRPWQIDQWLTPDQQAQRLFHAGKFQDAAKLFTDPLHQGTAWYRAGKFKEAERAFSRDGSAEGAYDRGNSLIMLGKYDDAIHSYARALQLRPHWKEAEDNQALAQARKDRLTQSGGSDEGTEGQLKADATVFDDHPQQNQGETVEVAGGPPLSDDELRTLWLRRVQTRPADFLKARFSYQLHQQEETP